MIYKCKTQRTYKIYKNHLSIIRLCITHFTNRHEYRTIADTLQLMKTCQKGTRMNCWEALYMQVFHQHKVLITEQRVTDTNPLYEPVNTTQILPCNPQPVPRNITHNTHPQSGTFSAAYNLHNTVSIYLASIQLA